MRALAWAALLAVIVTAGCGGGAPSPEAAAPFRKAVEAHLAAQNMEMRPDAFATLSVSGDTATAEVLMAAKGIEYGIRTRWTFRFAKKAGAWQVSDVKR